METQCRGTGKSETLRAAFIRVARTKATPPTCILMTRHPSGLCNFCRRTETR